MSEDNTAIYHRLNNVWNEGNLGILDELLAADFAYHDPNNPEVCSREDYKQFLSEIRAIFPDFHHTVEDTFAAGDKVAYRGTARGTHTGGTAAGLPPTGKQVTFSVIGITRFAGGKIVEDWIIWDAFNYQLQLGAIPPEE